MNNDEAAKAAAPILEMLLEIPERDRGEVIAAIKRNGWFCWHCGYGSKESPNIHCQCWNDE